MKSIEEIRRENFVALIQDHCKGNQTAAATVLGYDRPTLVNHWIKGRKEISTASARKIEESFELAPFWMDSEHNSAGTESRNTTGKTPISNDSQTVARNSIPGRKKFDKNVRPSPVGERQIPVISYVQAGMMTEVFDPFALGDGFELITTDLDLSGGAFGLIIEGDSMKPEFNEGDKVIIDPAVEPRPGDMVVAKNGREEATFKKYRPRGTDEHGNFVFELVPLNDDFPTLHSERDHLHVIGVMMEHRKYRKR
ncbi:peptidase S24-like protein [Paraburkholderia sp. BL8N3]|nr:peptidase S24-like protein [Paraburkholderia sp. BL8N3]